MRFSRLLGVVIALSLISCGARTARAQTTWVGTSGTALWDIGGNWSSGTAPAASGTASLVFNGSTLLTSTNNIGNLTLSNLTLSNTSVATNVFLLSGLTVSLTGNVSLSTAASGVTMNSDEFAFGMVLKNSNIGNFTINPRRTLIVSGSIGQDSTGRQLQKAGNGTLILTNTNNSFSTLTISGGGPVAVSQIGTAGLTSQTGTGGTIVFNGSELLYTGAGETSNKQIQIGSGSANTNGATITNSGSGALNLIGNGGLFTPTWASLSASRPLTIQGTNTGSNTIAAAIIDVSGSTAITLTKSGVGRWILSGSNTYTGATTVSAGTLQIGGGGTTGSLNTVSSIGVSSGATLAFSRSNTITQGTDFNSVLSGAGNVTQLGPGTLVLNGANTYTGTTTVTAGTLRFATQTALYNNGTANWTASKINVKNNATLALNVGGSGEFTQGDVSTLLTNLASSTSAATGMNASAILGFDTTNASTPFEITTAIANTTGASGGTRGLVKLGSGTLTLSGNNTYSGDTTVSGGLLSVNGQVAGAAAVASGATLGGSGVIGGVLSGAGLVSPGNSPGILTASQFDPTGGLDAAFELTGFLPVYNAPSASVNDILRLTSGTPFTSSLGGSNVIDFYFNMGSVDAGTYEAGFFTTLSAGDLLTALQNAPVNYWIKDAGGSQVFNGVNYSPYSGVTLSTATVTRDFGAGNVTGSVTQFIIVPEPESIILACGGIAVAAWAARRRRS